MASGSIIHPGQIERVSDHILQVRILSKSACSTCHAKGSCSVADIEEKIVEVENDGTRKWKPGDQVMVRMDESLGWKAVMMGYVFPLILLVLFILVFLYWLDHEGLAALLSLLMLVPYYVLLYVFRKRLKKEFSFRVEESEQF